ncbi:MAG: autotransporter domain-containing protein [Planctomycetaceae bacterium]|jgi:uncharacterized protein with beta-barrel porin domain|nr:autotransporter domain-containing protein [Planctomycetaceae bacterium]
MKPKFQKQYNQLRLIITTITIAALLFVLFRSLVENGGHQLLAADPRPLHNSPNIVKPPQSAGYSVFAVDDHHELNTVLSNSAVLNKWIKLEDNISVPGTMQFLLPDNGNLVIDLGMHNLQTGSNFYFDSNAPSNVTIIGSTMIANGGMQLHGETTLNYFGTYSFGRADILASDATDNVTFNLTGIHSRLDATNTIPKFVNVLPTAIANYETGTIVLGESGKATINLSSGNDAESGEIIVGAKANSKGELNLSGIYEVDDIYNPEKMIKKSTTWNNTGTLYIGYLGEGEANITSGAVFKAGSIGIGIDSDAGNTGKGVLNVEGIGDFIDKTKSQSFLVVKGELINAKDRDYIAETEFFNTDTTRIYIYGRDDEIKQPNDKHAGFLDPTTGRNTLKSIGNGTMNITNGTIIHFDETKTVSGEPSNYTPKITLGAGDSFVDNSIIIGARDAINGDSDNDGKPDPDKFDDVGLIDGTDLTGSLQANTLTFRNNAVLQGNLKIHIGENIFRTGSVLTPGFGSYDLYLPSSKVTDQERFGRVELKNNLFKHETDATTIIDFGVHGDQNYGSDPSKQTAYPNGGDNYGYADNEYYQGRDLITVEGNASLAGDAYFRPQTGYYSDKIKVDFIRASGTIDGQYERLHLYPYRWFRNPELLNDNQMNMLVADRNVTPFTDVARSFNQRGVGGALNRIYNDQSNDKWLPILNWFWLMNDEQLREAERLLSGELKASSFYMPLRSAWKYGFERVNWSEVGRKVYFGQQDSFNPQIKKSAFWATSFFDYMSIDDDHNVSSIATQRVSFMTGYDRALPSFCDVGGFSDSAFGVIFSYSQPKMDQAGCRVIADDYLVGFHFGTRVYSEYELKTWVGVGSQRYKLERHIPVPGYDPLLYSEYKGNSVSGSIQASRPVKWYGIMFRPLLGLDINYIKQNSKVESYGDDVMRQVALRYYGSDWFQTFGRVGLRVDSSKRKIYGRVCNLTASIGYSYLLCGDQAPESVHEFAYAGGGKFKILGNNLGRSFVNVDVGGQLHLNKDKNRFIYIMYNSNYGKYMNAHAMSVGYQFMF